MRGPLAAFFAALSIAGCSAFVSLDGLLVPDGGMPGDGGGEDSSDAGLDMQAADTGVDNHVPACPSGRGVPMVEVDGHCVDTLETSYADYLAFTAQLDGGLGTMPPECAFKTTNDPTNVPGNKALPVVWTDWCDAWAYCQWAGKELCGAPGGGPVLIADLGDWTKSLWMAACSHDGTTPYPYGAKFQSGYCQLSDPDGGAGAFSVPSGSNKKCEGGFPGIYDMIGNVREWENSCSGTAGAPDDCRRRGGAFNETDESYVRCDYAETYTRDFRSATSGFRCCAQKK
jgi:formylglycine-generating enzyme required for sulfatase activity